MCSFGFHTKHHSLRREKAWDRRRPLGRGEAATVRTMGATSQSQAWRAGGEVAQTDCQRAGLRHMAPSGRRGRRVGAGAAERPLGGKKRGGGTGPASASRRVRLGVGLGTVLPLYLASLRCQNNPKGSFQTRGQTAVRAAAFY